MARAIVLLFLLGAAVANPAPKIASSDFGNSLENVADVNVKTNKLEETSRSSDKSLEDHIIEYVTKHDISVDLPLIGSKVTMDARNLDNDQLDVKVKFGSGKDVESRSRKKSKLKKIFAPILLIILIKAMILIPLALGILGIKTWNAIQISFLSFVTSIVLAVWKFCAKIYHPEPPEIVHSAYDAHLHHLDAHAHLDTHAHLHHGPDAHLHHVDAHAHHADHAHLVDHGHHVDHAHLHSAPDVHLHHHDRSDVQQMAYAAYVPQQA